MSETAGKAPQIELDVEGDEVQGALAFTVAPGTVAKVIDRTIDQLLGDRMDACASALGVVLSAPPSAFVRPLPGKDEEGRTRYVIKARAEGARLVPAHGKTRRR